MYNKRICELLKRIRQEIAEQNGITYFAKHCPNEECSHICPKCEREGIELMQKLREKGVSESLCININKFPELQFVWQEEQRKANALFPNGMPLGGCPRTDVHEENKVGKINLRLEIRQE